ncbi:poly-beta-1,6-N-acetyl-D-glucosamine biosynthesis protein PgaD, partial [Xanthomonas campestris pv. raphani]
MTPPIINLPQRLGRSRRLAYGAATAGAWMIYFYLWAPLATLIAWFFGLRSALSVRFLSVWVSRAGVGHRQSLDLS